ncbi:MAG: ribosome maturation factor RimM [Desulfomonilaceae bacterium]
MRNSKYWMKNHRLIVVGKSLKPIGLKGELKIFPYTESPDIFNQFEYLFIEGELLEVRKVRNSKGAVAVFLHGVETYEDADKLRGKLVQTSTCFLPDIEKDEYYWFQLIGLETFDAKNNYLGCVKSLMRTAAHDILQVNNGTKSIMIPMVDEIVRTVDLKQNRITVEYFEGMNPDD